MAVDRNDKIIDFVEKPAKIPAMRGDASKALASMGIYVFDADYLYELLAADDKDDASSHDFGKALSPEHPRRYGLRASLPLSCVQSDHKPNRTGAMCRYAGSLLEGELSCSTGDAGAGYV